MHIANRVVLFVALFFVVGLALGADEFKTIKAKSSTIVYERAVAKADDEHAKALDDARRQYIVALNEAMAEATQSSNLDEAVRIRDAIADLQKARESSSPPKQSLKQRLTGTTWNASGGHQWSFNANNTAVSDRNFKGTWQVVDERTIIVKFANFYVVSFNPPCDGATVRWHSKDFTLTPATDEK
jgi:hypothetical protein